MKAIRDHARRSLNEGDAIHELVGLLYEAAVDFLRWPAFLSRLAEVTDEGFASLVTREFGMESSTPGLILLRRIPRQNARFEEVYAVLGMHLRRALALQRRFRELETQNSAFEESLNRLATGIVLLDARLMVTYTNSSARRILEKKDGLLMRDGTLVAQTKGDSNRLTQALQELLGLLKPDRENAVVWVTRGPGRRPLGIVICRIDSGARVASAVAVYVSDSESGMLPDRELLQQLYSLTPAESILALHLLQGDSLEESAQELRVSLNTARTHLKRVLNKTETRRQADLIRLLLTGPACLRL